MDEKGLIESIRKKRFNIGLDTNNIHEMQLALEDAGKCREDAVRLVSDLNTVKTHFILELIQNAEDNSYQNCEIPEISLIICNNRLVFQNNETGFTKENVEALCSIGRSTKKDKAMGYIGEKGIGFKSVFLISNRVDIYSNNYHFKFEYDKKDPLSMIKPILLEEIPDFIDVRITNIILYVNEEDKKYISDYSKISSEFLLFLKKLKRINIINRITGETSNIERYDNNGRILVKCNNIENYWKNIRKIVDVSHIEEYKRIGVKQRELMMAFPLNSNGTADTENIRDIFAYLPVRNYGFRFIIHADFLLSASREDIHKKGEWNEYLRDNIIPVFLEAVEEFKKDDNLKNTYYNYIPLKEEVNDAFFLTAVKEIYSRLKEKECILTEDHNWRKPSDILYAEKEEKELIPNKALNNILNKEYLSSQAVIKKELLEILNCERFGIKYLLDVLKNSDWLDKQSDDWFGRLYNYLAGIDIDKDIQCKLKKLKIIRLENRQLTSINEGTIFFPLDTESDYGFEQEIRIIKRETIIQNKKDNKIIDFLNKLLGIKKALPGEIIKDHILKIYKYEDQNLNWKNKTKEILSGYILYIKDNIDNIKEEILDELKEYLVIRTDKSIDENEYACAKHVYLPDIYLSEEEIKEHSMEELFHGISEVLFLHKDYIEFIEKDEKKKKQAINKWKEFFVKLGVNIIPRATYFEGLVRRRSYPTREEQLEYGYDIDATVEDWELSEEFIALLESGNEQKISRVIEILDKCWDKYSAYFKMRYNCTKWLSSTFIRQLKEKLTFPTTIGILAKGSDVFLNKNEFKEILEDSVLYLAKDLNEEVNFVKYFNINSEVTINRAMEYLKQLVSKNTSNKDKFAKIYTVLNDNKNFEDNNNEVIIKNFTQNKLIFIPDSIQKYYSLKEVIWKDGRRIFGETRGYLERHYPNLRSFFVDKLKINEKPQPVDYLNVLLELSTKEKISEKEEKIIIKIYEVFNNNLESILEEEWWSSFISERVFLTDKGEFCHRDECLINDSSELYELFKGQINFLKLPENYYSQIESFINSVNIPYLSREVKSELKTELIEKFNEEILQNRIRSFAPYIESYLYKIEPRIYNEHKEEKILNKLKCYSVKHLVITYQLRGISVESREKVFLCNDDLYVQEKWLNETDYLAIELSKLFGNPKGLSNFIVSLFDKKDKEKIKKLLSAMGLAELSVEEDFEPGYECNTYKETDEKEIGSNDIPDVDDECGKHESYEGLKEVLETVKGQKNRLSHLEEKGMVKNRSNISTRPPCQSPEYLGNSSENKSENREYNKNKERSFMERSFTPGSINTLVAKARNTENFIPDEEVDKSDVKVFEWKAKCKPEEVLIVPVPFDKGKDNPEKAYPDKFSSGGYPSGRCEAIGESSYSRSKNKKSSGGINVEENKEVGRFGEECIYLYLKKKFKDKYKDYTVKDKEIFIIEDLNGKEVVIIKWFNRRAESMNTYDIGVTENGITEYIDVKSTKTDGKEWFDVTENQWKLAKSEGDKFSIYRVYNVGEKYQRLSIIKNLYRLWQEGMISGAPVRIQL